MGEENIKEPNMKINKAEGQSVTCVERNTYTKMACEDMRSVPEGMMVATLVNSLENRFSTFDQICQMSDDIIVILSYCHLP